MLEIEMKFPVKDFEVMRATLQTWGAQQDTPIQESDHYFNAPDRDFAQTDEALRVRRIGSRNRVTYKGPRQAGPAKTRTEIEVGLDAGDQAAEGFCRLLTHLGYRQVAVVRKQRIVYHLKRDPFALEVCLDDVSDVGRFAEVEIMAGQEDLDQARGVLQDVAAALGLKDAERRSYLEMLLAVRVGAAS
jgi:adenylate cyclase class 2